MRRIDKINVLLESVYKNELMQGINDDLPIDLGTVSREVMKSVPVSNNPNKTYNKKQVRDYNLTDFVNYVKDNIDNEGNFNSKDEFLSTIFSKKVPNLTSGSNINGNKIFRKEGTFESALKDIWTYVLQMNGLHKNIVESVYKNETLHDNLKLTSVEEDTIDNIRAELRSQKINALSNLDQVLDYVDKLKGDNDYKYKIGYGLSYGYEDLRLNKFKFQELTKKYPWTLRTLNNKDTYIMNNNLGGAFYYKFTGMKNGKYVFTNVSKGWESFGDSLLTKDEVMEKVKDSYANLKIAL